MGADVNTGVDPTARRATTDAEDQQLGHVPDETGHPSRDGPDKADGAPRSRGGAGESYEEDGERN